MCWLAIWSQPAALLGVGPVMMVPDGMPAPDPVGLCRCRACYGRLRVFGLSHCVALWQLGSRLPGGVTE
jgi:hypothetical protein